MPIQNIGNVAPAPQPVRHASDGVPNVVAKASVESQPVQPAPHPPSPEQLKSAVDGINQVLRQSNRSMEFSIDTETKRTVVKLMDTETGELIRQFPSEDALAISRAIGQFQKGLLLRQEA